jgi:4-hydroxybenzoate polyprenyltransferase
MKRLPTTVLGLAQACHPFPLVAVLCLTALIGAASAKGDLDASLLARCVLAMFGAQLAIGWGNDYVDRERDAVFQPSKPIASGRVPARIVPPLVVVAILAAIAVGATLGAEAVVFLAIGTGAGLAYDFGLKDTRWSWAPFVVAFCALPPYVWSALDVWRDELLFVYLVALPLVLAAHIANTLPDIETDREAGRRGVAVVLGRESSLRVMSLLLVAPVLLAAIVALWVEYEAVVLIATVIVYGKLLAGAAFAYKVMGGRNGAVWGFRCVTAASILFAAGWVAAVA